MEDCMSNLRGNHSRSSREYGGNVTYFCSGGGTHTPVAYLSREQDAQGLRCPLCGLTKRIGYRARQRLTRAGLTEVDISALPF
jgi:hypothetical protein